LSSESGIASGGGVDHVVLSMQRKIASHRLDWYEKGSAKRTLTPAQSSEGARQILLPCEVVLGLLLLLLAVPQLHLLEDALQLLLTRQLLLRTPPRVLSPTSASHSLLLLRRLLVRRIDLLLCLIEPRYRCFIHQHGWARSGFSLVLFSHLVEYLRELAVGFLLLLTLDGRLQISLSDRPSILGDSVSQRPREVNLSRLLAADAVVANEGLRLRR
jgi:hypothetical protein